MDADCGIKGFLDTSFVDWPGRMAAVVFLGGCNFRCPFCHNPELVVAPSSLPSIPVGEVLERLAPLRGWVDGVVVSGGEPTLNPRLPELLGLLRRRGFEVKLDTNGSRPAVLAELLAAGLAQAVDMDVKAPLEDGDYARLAGVPVPVGEIAESMRLVAGSGLPHRFRTTWVPGLLDGGALARLGAAVPPGSPFELQPFRPDRVLDPALRALPATLPAELAALRSSLRAGADPLFSASVC